MSFYDAMLDKITEAAEATEPYAKIVYGSDPPKDGICMIPSAGAPADTHLNKGMIIRLPILLNGKNADQEKLLNDLTAIHEALTRRTDYSEFTTINTQVVNIETMSLPAIIGREQNKQWICGSTLAVYFYWRK